MKTGYLSCRLCGAETNCVELTAGLCPACARQLAALSPRRAEYIWFVAAVRRALFGR